MQKFHNFLRLSSLERKLLIRTFILLAVVRLMIGMIPLRFLKTVIKGLIPQNPLVVPSAFSLDQIVWAVSVASPYIPGAQKCLIQAAATYILLKQNDFSADFRVGVAKSENGRLEAHAWIEHQGKAVVGEIEDISRFVSLPSFLEA